METSIVLVDREKSLRGRWSVWRRPDEASIASPTCRNEIATSPIAPKKEIRFVEGCKLQTFNCHGIAGAHHVLP